MSFTRVDLNCVRISICGGGAHSHVREGYRLLDEIVRLGMIISRLLDSNNARYHLYWGQESYRDVDRTSRQNKDALCTCELAG